MTTIDSPVVPVEPPSGPAAIPQLLRAALHYAEMGWPVFPIVPRGKKPVIPRAHPKSDPCRGECGREGHGLYDATLDPETITRWWTGWPTANIGLRTGVAFDVLDVDGHHDGWKSLAYATAEFGRLSSSPVASTPRGGCHFYFLPTGRGCKVDLLPGIDWRGKGGYVVAPPSVGPNGASYEWQVPPKEQELQPAPPWLTRAVAAQAGTLGVPAFSARRHYHPLRAASTRRRTGPPRHSTRGTAQRHAEPGRVLARTTRRRGGNSMERVPPTTSWPSP